MLSIIEAAGWPIWPLIAASIIALGIIGERAWSLRTAAVAPRGLLADTVREFRAGGATPDLLARLSGDSPLGRVFAAGLRQVRSPRDVVRDAVEEAGRAAARDLDRFLTTLGTIATMAPLLGLLGTIIGMIEIFGAQAPTGMANPAQLARGISVALYNAAFGIIVAVPSLVFYRHFRARADELVTDMELQAVKLVEVLLGERNQ